MKLKLYLLLTILFIGWDIGAQKVLNGITLPPSLKADNTELVLNGAGIRKKLFFKLYTGGLYLTAKNKNAMEIVTADKSTGFRMVITSGVLNSNNMSEAIEEGFSKSLKGNTASMKTKIDQLIVAFKSEEIKEGDIFELVYSPGIGVKALKNGKLKATITGLDFKKALFGIWLGEDPVDADLKTGLLGG